MRALQSEYSDRVMNEPPGDESKREPSMTEDLIFDIGMHKGEDTAFYLKKGFRVIGIEADAELASHCRRRFAEEISNGLVIILEGAVVAKDKLNQSIVTFYKNPNASVWSTAIETWRDRNVRLGKSSQEIKVQCLDLGGILSEYGVPYYMKVDIEGADRYCLQYLENLPELPRYLSIEDAKTDFNAFKKELGVLCALGYRRFSAVQQANIPGGIYRGCDRLGREVNHCFEPESSGVFGEDLEGLWMSPAELLVEYKWIYSMYEVFGDNSPFAPGTRSLFGRKTRFPKLRKDLSRRLNRPLPGWYDTHASLS
jgi:FkbM family methyltransferase